MPILADGQRPVPVTAVVCRSIAAARHRHRHSAQADPPRAFGRLVVRRAARPVADALSFPSWPCRRSSAREYIERYADSPLRLEFVNGELLPKREDGTTRRAHFDIADDLTYALRVYRPRA